jgi:predicted RNA-binding Zn-ribbon protein involved in translation (DUF1610 family)
MTDSAKIKCPECGAAMNHHAVKLEYDSDEPADPVFEGVVKNVHTCPHCGDVEMISAE